MSLQSPEPVPCQPAVEVLGLIPRLNHARSSVTSHSYNQPSAPQGALL